MNESDNESIKNIDETLRTYDSPFYYETDDIASRDRIADYYRAKGLKTDKVEQFPPDKKYGLLIRIEGQIHSQSSSEPKEPRFNSVQLEMIIQMCTDKAKNLTEHQVSGMLGPEEYTRRWHETHTQLKNLAEIICECQEGLKPDPK
jgi:hypothetical protein